MPPSTFAFAAVLLAGGRSRRMGVDKATLSWRGQPLWAAQLATLRALAPMELLVSGRLDGPYAEAGVEVIPDTPSERGPLGGIAATLRRTASPWLLVLAVDLPLMPAGLLGRLLQAAAQEGRGLIPQSAGGLEPLAAVYPRTALLVAEELLAQGRWAVRGFAEELFARGWARAWPIPEDEVRCFANANTPEAWQRLQR